MSVDIDLAGQRLLVVGGSSGIGRSTALAAADAGADIMVVGRSEDKLKEVVTTAGKGTGIAADVRDPERCSGIVAEAVDAMGGLDALVFSTAVSPLAPLDEVSAETWQDVITTNAIAPALVAQAALDHLPDNGVVIFLSSITVGGGHHGLASYGASKAALDRTVRVVAHGASRQAVRVHGGRATRSAPISPATSTPSTRARCSRSGWPPA